MKVAILGESEADEAAVRILVDGILGFQTIVAAPHPRIRTRGWPAVKNLVRPALLYVHDRTDADALAVVVDSNGSPPHDSSVDSSPCHSACRLCLIRRAVADAQESLSRRETRRRIFSAIGLAIPAVEAWYRCLDDNGVCERAWRDRLVGQGCGFDRISLKRDVYGTDRPSIALETDRASEAARQLVQDIPRVRQNFPIGFGALIDDIVVWRDG